MFPELSSRLFILCGRLAYRPRDSLRIIAFEHYAKTYRLPAHDLVCATYMWHDGNGPLRSRLKKRRAKPLRARGKAKDIRIAQQSGKVGLIELAKQEGIAGMQLIYLSTLTSLSSKRQHEAISEQRSCLCKLQCPLLWFKAPDRDDEHLAKRM